jgi:hypothetical protein
MDERRLGTVSGEMAYVALHSCGGWVYVSVDAPSTAKETAYPVAQCIRNGYTIERHPVDAIKNKVIAACRCRRGTKGRIG